MKIKATRTMTGIVMLITMASVIAALVQSGAGLEAGMKIVLSEAGLQNVIDVMLPYGIQLYEHSMFPDMTGNSSVPILGTIDFRVSNLQLTKIGLGDRHTLASLSAPDRVGMEIRDGTLEFVADWWFKEERWPHKTGSGKLTGSAVITKLVGNTTLSADATGHPTVSGTKAWIELGKIIAKVSGSGSDPLYQSVVDALIPTLKTNIEKAAATDIPAIIDSGATAAFSTLPMQHQLSLSSDEIAFDYRFIGPIKVSETYGVAVPFRGEVYVSMEGLGHTPGKPSALPDGEKKSMFEMYISDWAMLSISRTKWRRSEFTSVHTKDNVPKAISKMFVSGYYKDIALNLVKMYGNDAEVAIINSAMDAPAIVPKKDNTFSLIENIRSVFLVRDSKTGSFVEAFRVNANASFIGTLRVATTATDSIITGEIKKENFVATVVSSSVGTIDVKSLTLAYDTVTSLAGEKINAVLKAGIPLQPFLGIKFNNPEITWGAGYLLLSGDGEYTPTARCIEALRNDSKIRNFLANPSRHKNLF